MLQYAVSGDSELLGPTKHLILRVTEAPTTPHPKWSSASPKAGDTPDCSGPSMSKLDAFESEAFGEKVASAIVDWIGTQLSDYHANFMDVFRMQVCEIVIAS